MDVLPISFRIPAPLAADRRGVTMLEYAIMGSIVAAMLVVAVGPMTDAVSSNLQFIANQIPAPH